MNRDNRVSIFSADIASNIGGDIARRMLSAGYAPDSVFDEAFEACENAALVLDRLTAYEIAREAGDDESADSLLTAAIHFRACMLRRLPDTVDLRILAGDVPGGVEIITRGEPHDMRP